MKKDSQNLKEIFDLAKKLNELYEISYKQLLPDVKYIIEKNVKNTRFIECTLDNLLNIPTDKSYELFVLLCNYYESINADAAKFYLDSWNEIYGNENNKVKKKDHK